jgi:hypothetical protein
MHLQENIKNTQHSKVGCVNLGARIALKVSRKFQDVLLLADVTHCPEGFCNSGLLFRQSFGMLHIRGLLGCPGFIEKEGVCPDK